MENKSKYQVAYEILSSLGINSHMTNFYEEVDIKQKQENFNKNLDFYLEAYKKVLSAMDKPNS